jgi:hypothetical protein
MEAQLHAPMKMVSESKNAFCGKELGQGLDEFRGPTLTKDLHQ